MTGHFATISSAAKRSFPISFPLALNHKSDVLILGAGAAGLMCAIEAGKRGRKVTVLERADRIGEKILISGGGRCNSHLGGKKGARARDAGEELSRTEADCGCRNRRRAGRVPSAGLSPD